MSYTRLIHDYLDGEIAGSTQEEVLFNVLASDEELRSEFKRQVRIHTIAQKDMAMMVPPAELTNSVFTGLGFDAPGFQTQTNASSGNFQSAVRKYSSLFLLLLFISSAAGVGYFYVENTGLKDKIAQNSSLGSNNFVAQNNYPISNSQENNTAIPNENMIIDGANNNGANNNGGSNDDNIRHNYKSNHFATASSSNSNLNIIADKSDINISENNAIADRNREIISSAELTGNYNSIATLMINPSMNSAFPEFQSSLMGDNFNLPEFQFDNSKWQIVFRRLSAFSYEADNISARIDNPLANFSFAIFRKFNSFHSVGVEIGSEQFSQVFPSSNDKINYTQLQNPMLVWAGITYRFTPKEYLIPYKLYPYAQLSASGTTIGPIFRGQTGLNWQLVDNFNLMLGYDYGALFYNVSGNIYNSPKSGWVFGAGYNF